MSCEDRQVETLEAELVQASLAADTTPERCAYTNSASYSISGKLR